ncbi:hypothetical protein [Pedobacter miscanthi]|uniref:hypothetical protein n=1 Tax=Pedobacter miscanthi TaxID=2259170 RepID=UPI00292FC812|nr:hypothetical protein [Pedobacter miscanthi]
MAEVTFGLDRNTQSIKHISEVQSGLSCNCNCIQCGKAIKAAKGQVQEHHFKHHELSDCTASFESVLHLTAKKIIQNGCLFNTGANGVISYSASELEKVDGVYRYDAFITTPDKSIAIEIVVTNQLSQSKYDYIRLIKQRCIQIDLQEVDRNINYDDLEKLVLANASCKRTIWWDGESQVTISNDSSSDQAYWLLLLPLALLYKPLRKFVFKLFE